MFGRQDLWDLGGAESSIPVQEGDPPCRRSVQVLQLQASKIVFFILFSLSATFFSYRRSLECETNNHCPQIDNLRRSRGGEFEI